MADTDESQAGGATMDFMIEVMEHFAGFNSVLLAALGDQLGLFKSLKDSGPATSGELSERTGTNERYIREWLSGMFTAGYLDYDSSSGKFRLPGGYAPVLAEEGGPFFFAPMFQLLKRQVDVFESVAKAFKEGGGVSQDEYSQDHFEQADRMNAGLYDHFLVPMWIQAVMGLPEKLAEGIDAADVGSGSGRVLIRLAEAFPNSRFVGYDIFERQVHAARANAREAGVGDRIRFEQRDVAQGIDEQFDLITVFDVVHDAADPAGLLASVREALKPEGRCLCLEFNYSEKLEDNVGPWGTWLYGASIFYCMTTSLAQGGEGLGTVGLPESKLRAIAQEAGFSSVDEVFIGHPVQRMFELRP